MEKTKLSTVIASLYAMAAVALPPAGAAEAEQAKAPTNEQLDTVVITAQKRKEDPNKVALSVSTLGGAELAAQHVTDYADLTRALPNISFSGADGTAGMSNIEIRGISSAAGSATVGIYMDDVSMTVSNASGIGASEPKLFDIDRVEVLRGPQGTLYGGSSMGGTIKFISNQPDLKQREFSTYSEVSSTKGGSLNYSANVVANLPLVENELGLRFGVQKGYDSGYIKQLNAGGGVVANRINGVDDEAMRAALLWKPNADLTLMPALFYQRVYSHDVNAFLTALPGYATNKLMREPGIDHLLVPSLTVGYNLGFADLTAVSSYFQRKFDTTRDATAYNSQFLPIFLTDAAPAGLGAAIAALPSVSLNNARVYQVSQELRLASKPYQPAVSPVTWVAGLYGANLRTSNTENDPIFGVNAAFKAYGVSPSDPTVLTGAVPSGFPGDNTYTGSHHYQTREKSVFGELNYYFLPTLHATLGMRYMRADSTLLQQNDLFFANGQHRTEPEVIVTASTPKFALTWEVDPTNTVYASASKGFRLGGGNGFVPPGICRGDLQKLGLTDAPTAYGADSLWSYEAGSKSRLLGNRLSVNASVFYVSWDDIQQFVSLPGCGFGYTANVGTATSKGMEIEIKGKPMAGVLLGLSGGYTHATLSDNVGLERGGIVGATAGAQIYGVPKFNAALTAQYNFAVSDVNNGFVRAAAHWVGSSHGSLDPGNPDYFRPAYHTLDASAGIGLEWADITVFMKNLLDESRIIQHPNILAVSNGYRVSPRSIGMSLSTRF